MSTYNDTRINYTVGKFDDQKQPVTDDKGEQVIEVTKNESEKSKSYAKLVTDLHTAGLPEPEITKIQTFQYTEVGDGDPTADLINVLSSYNQDAEQVRKVAASIINRGLVLRQQTIGREFMNDDDQTAVEGVYDLMTDAAKPGEGRRKADPASKAVKALSELLGQNITADDLAALLASFKQTTA